MDERDATLILGANGQLGRELRRHLPNAELAGRADVDLANPELENLRDWSRYRTIINAAAYTNVDEAETPQGRRDAWAANAHGVAGLARIAARNETVLVHVSTDYVFDGSMTPHSEDEPLSPLGVYGQSKAAGDVAVMTGERHYVIRTSWVIGDGANFVRTMASLAARGVQPKVVSDQFGRLSFTSTIAEGILHLLHSRAPYGTYNITNSGIAMSWAGIARIVYQLAGCDPNEVTGVTTADYFRGTSAAPRPLQSELDLARIVASGFTPTDHVAALEQYIADAGAACGRSKRR